MKNKEIYKTISLVYINYGIIPIGKVSEKLTFPTGIKSTKIEAVFDDNDEIVYLTYDPDK